MSVKKTLLALSATLTCLTANADTLVDVLGREVELSLPVDNLILTEGRQFYLLSALKGDSAAEYVSGWRDDMESSDPYNYRQFAQHYPSLTSLPTFGRFTTDGFDIEQAVALQPDAVIVNVTGDSAEPQQEIINKLAQIDIPVVFVDFRHDILAGVPRTFEIFGELLGEQARTQEIMDFRQSQIDRITDVIAQAEPQRPSVFIERIGGYSDDCCLTFGTENFGRMVEMAGGTNVASAFVDGVFGQLDPEQVLVSNPEHIVVTTADWEAFVPGGRWVPVGPGADQTQAQEKLAYYPTKPAYANTQATELNNYHAIWHGFYTSPFQFVALQYLAVWLHPELFSEVSPDDTFAEFHQRFLPIDFEPGYAVSLASD